MESSSMYSQKAEQCMKEGRKKLKGKYRNNARKLLFEPRYEQIVTGRRGSRMFQAGSNQLQAGQELGRGRQGVHVMCRVRSHLQGRAVGWILRRGSQFKIKDQHWRYLSFITQSASSSWKWPSPSTFRTTEFLMSPKYKKESPKSTKRTASSPSPSNTTERLPKISPFSKTKPPATTPACSKLLTLAFTLFPLIMQNLSR